MKSGHSVDRLVTIDKSADSVSNIPLGMPFTSSKLIKIYRDENYNQPLSDAKFYYWDTITTPRNPNLPNGCRLF